MSKWLNLVAVSNFVMTKCLFCFSVGVKDAQKRFYYFWLDANKGGVSLYEIKNY